ncbi:MAG TPA: ABC transporter ATP-binding protein [Bacillales bacterium]
MIELKDVQKIYEDGFQALKNINLKLEDGKINVLIGPSGCGKTTTMKMLNRLIEQSRGTINIDGTDISTMNPIELRRGIGYVIQSIGLFPHMTIYENVATVPKLLKWDKAKINDRVTELLEMVNLDPDTYKGRYPSELSGGQQQRIGVIRALAAEPSIILMDEPFSALDPISREELQDELIRLQREIHKTIVFVTHDMDEALKIADQIILMQEGEIVQMGSPEELLRNPANQFVENFIGSERMAQAKDLPSIEEILKDSVVSAGENGTTNEALGIMSEQQLDSLPVTDDKGVFLGQVSLYQALENPDTKLSDLKLQKEGFVSTEDHLSRALHYMEEYRLNVPVTDVDRQLIGIITKSQLLAIMHSYYDTKNEAAI